jgi:hypothetical protein
MGRYISTTPTAGSALRVDVTSNYSAVANDRILADTSGGAFTITLPADTDVIAGDVVQIIDISGTSGTNAITVGRNGSNIQSAAEDLTIDVNNTVVTLTYANATYGWIVTGS